MQIDNVVGYSSFMQHYGSYNISPVDNKIPASSDDISEKQIQKTQENTSPAVSDEPSQFQQAPRKDASLADIQTSFGNSSESTYNGFAGNSIVTQDMKKAISDMQKDQVLQEYQYFVGGSRNSGSRVMTQDEDGVVVKLG